MKGKNQTVIAKVMKRLLSPQYPQKLLNSLVSLEECSRYKEFCTKEYLEKSIYFLKGREFNFSDVIVLRHQLMVAFIEKINAWAEAEVGEYRYNIGILFLALQCVSHKSEKISGINTDNANIKFCQNYMERALSICGDDKTLKIAIKGLKEI